ncbi:MAG: hypothetical protein ACPHK8_06800 [Thermoplasmatota archaeon]
MTREGYLQGRNMALMAQSRHGKDITGPYNFIRRAMYASAEDALRETLAGLEEKHHAGAREEYADMIEEGYE